MRDSYLRFFSNGYITKEQFFDFGLNETIYAPDDKVEEEWNILKHNIYNNKKIFIRGFGRDANGTHLFQKLYLYLFGNEKVTKDSTNNAEPTKLIRKTTGYSKSKSGKYELIRNYQISHVFGRTKNVFMFMAPWNIVYIPKMLDPFTGHEAKGELIDEYTTLFQKQSFERFERFINEYNGIVSNPSFQEKLNESLDKVGKEETIGKNDIEKLKKAVETEFAPIEIIT